MNLPVAVITGITAVAVYYAFKRTKNILLSLAAGIVVWVVASRVVRAPEGFLDVSPFAHLPRPVAPARCADNGDLVLTNLYRRLHNLESIQRGEVFQFNDALAGGSPGIGVEPYVGAAYEREMNHIKASIRDIIESRRLLYSELYDTPTKAAFVAGPDDLRILGIPSQVGEVPRYY